MLVVEVDAFHFFFWKFWSILCGPFAELIEAYLELSFYVVIVSCSIADQEVIHIQSTVCSAINVFQTIINFDIKQTAWQTVTYLEVYPFLVLFLLYFIEVKLLSICSSAMFNSVFVKYKMFSSLFLLASGVNWARHEVLNPSQLALPRFQLGVLLLNSSLLFSNCTEKWPLPLVSSCTFPSKPRNRLGSHNFKSIAEYVPVAGSRYVFDLLLFMHNWCLFNNDYITLLFLSVFLLLQILLWLLKSLIIMKSLGNCSIKLFSTDSLSSSHGGIYTEYTVIVLWRVADIATACMFLFRVISLWGMLLLMINDDPLQGLSVCCLI